jgi:hypothetical protein
LKQFKLHPGKPVPQVSKEEGELRGAGAQGTCIVCGHEMNWYCIWEHEIADITKKARISTILSEIFTLCLCF